MRMQGKFTSQPRDLIVIGTRGNFHVCDDLGGHGAILAGPFETHAEAWRALDRLSGEPVSKAEDTSEWVWNKMARGEA